MTHQSFQGYMGEKRKRLVNKYGFDTKNASHMIRLLRMCVEFLTTNKFHVKREDAKELLDIKDGLWTLDKINKEADLLFKAADDAYEKSKLPESVDTSKVDELCFRILKSRFDDSKSSYKVGFSSSDDTFK